MIVEKTMSGFEIPQNFLWVTVLLESASESSNKEETSPRVTIHRGNYYYINKIKGTVNISCQNDAKIKKLVPKDDMPIQEISALADKWSHFWTFSQPNQKNSYIPETFKQSEILQHEFATNLSESDAENKCEYKDALQDIVGDAPQPMEEHGIAVEEDMVEAEQKDVEKEVLGDTVEDRLRDIIGASLEHQTLEKRKRGRPKKQAVIVPILSKKKSRGRPKKNN